MRSISAPLLAVGVLVTGTLFTARAWAQEPPKKLWTRFDSQTPHQTIAGNACQLQGRTLVAGQYKPIEIHAQEDASVICWSAQPTPDAVHIAVMMTNDPNRGPTQIVLEVEVPPGSPQNVIEDLRTALRNTEAELQRRVGTSAPVQQQQQVVQQPVIVVQPAPTLPMHPEPATNWGLIGGGIGMLTGGYVLSALMGATLIEASGDPGTPRWWPFVPVVGATVFTATYKEAPGCNCGTGRVFSVLGAVAIDAIQAAGVVMILVGIASPKTRMVPDNQVGIRIRPDGFIEGRF